MTTKLFKHPSCLYQTNEKVLIWLTAAGNDMGHKETELAARTTRHTQLRTGCFGFLACHHNKQMFPYMAYFMGNTFSFRFTAKLLNPLPLNLSN